MFSGTNNYVIYSAGSPSDKREEFMMAATVLGGSKWHRVKNHVWPHVLPSFFTCCSTICEYFITSLASWLVRVIFCGTIIFGTEADSVTKEWTGLIGQNFRHLTTHTWIVLIPIAFYSMTILAGNLISNSMQDAIKLGNVRKLERESKELQVEKQVQLTMDDFSFIERYKIKKDS